MAFAHGARLGAYEILAPLGAGGMGEVYRARDPRLGREVAIKVLPTEFASNPERLRRFELEARAAAALNHPNILAVYDIGSGSQERTPYIVSELLEGETLRDRLRDGTPALSAQKAVDYAIQIAHGLAAAHDKGILHRDLKPENVFVTTDERVKILDFGLAKLTKDKPAALSALPTSPPPTEPGLVLGTVGYMSPEQVRGLTADHRSDVFALGTILYELLSGRRAFQRDTSAETMTAILNEDPPELTAEPRIAPALGRIVMRCLGKNPANRFQTASDLAFALEGLSASGDSGAAVKALDVKATSGRRREQAAWVAAAVSLVAAITAMVLLLSRPAPELPSFRLDVTTPPTTAPAAFALSPDGSQIVFAATADGVSRLWRRALDQTTAQPLPGTEGATNPFWAPDSRSIGFFADGRLKRLDLAGGPPQDLAEAPDNRGGTWSRDGVILFAPGIGGGLRRVPAKGGTVAVVPGDGGRFPAFLPDGRRFVFFLGPTSPDRQGIYLGSLDAPDARRLVPADVAGAYVVPGYLLMQRQGVLVAVPFDATREAIMGDPIPIAQTAGVDFGFFRSAFSVSATGLLAYRTGTERRQLVWNDRRGNDVGTLGPPDETDRLYPEVAPDGLSVAIQRFVKGNFDLWLIDGRGVWDPFTTDPGVDRATVWAPDGSRLVFSANRTGVYDLFEKVAGSTGNGRVVFTSPANKLPADWSPDGNVLLFVSASSNTGRDLWALPLSGAQRPFPAAVQTPANEDEGQFSPDGKWIAFTSDESEMDEIYLEPFPPSGNRSRVSPAGGGQPRWRRDGTELFYIARDGKLMAVPIDLRSTGKTPVAGAPVPLFATRLASRGARKQQYAVAKDGQRFLMNVAVDEATRSPITIVQNWMAGLK